MFFHRGVFIIEMFFYAWLFAWLINSNFPFLFLFLFFFAVLYDNKFAIRCIYSWFDQFKICKMIGNRPVRVFGFRNPGNFCSTCKPECSQFFLWNLEFWALEFELQLKESGSFYGLESGIQVSRPENPESSIGNQNSRRSWNPSHGAIGKDCKNTFLSRIILKVGHVMFWREFILFLS